MKHIWKMSFFYSEITTFTCYKQAAVADVSSHQDYICG